MKKNIIKILLWIVFLMSITNVSANYTKNIDDEVKLYNLTRQILLDIEKSENTKVLQKNIQNKMAELLWKTHSEIGNSYSQYNKNFNTFREYGLTYIYHHIMYDINTYYISWKWKILENSFARVFVNTPDIYMTEKGVFLKRDHWNDWNMVEFFKTKENIETYITQSILEQQFDWKCRAIKSKTVWNLFNDNQTYTLGAFWEYEWDAHNLSDCWKYWRSYGIRFFERRGNYIIYLNAGQDFNGLFYRFIKIK